jgi:ABC-type antimicrobial peptide transport system permease subunit
VINESFARKYFGANDPIGRQIRIPDDADAAAGGVKAASFKIIGVARDTKQLNLRDTNLLQIYLPCPVLVTLPGILLPHGMIFQLRTAGDPQLLVASVLHALHATDPKMRSMFVTTMDDAIDQVVFQERMIAQTAGFFSLFALLLASLGLYGVLAYNVTQRTREIGVRMALGARSGNIISLILQQGVGMTAVGCVAGTAAAMALAHLIASRLYGVPALDPLTFLFTIVVLMLVALLACWLPARRATKVDPMIALRAE